MHERKQLMYDLADGFVALPGGLGTLEELAEVLTWNQLGIVAKPVVLLDVDGDLERPAVVDRPGRRRRLHPRRARRPRSAASSNPPTSSAPSPPRRCRSSASGSTWRRRDDDGYPVAGIVAAAAASGTAAHAVRADDDVDEPVQPRRRRVPRRLAARHPRHHPRPGRVRRRSPSSAGCPGWSSRCPPAPSPTGSTAAAR